MSPIDTATSLHQEATTVIQQQRIIEVLARQAQVHVTGSYALDLMAYPDVDLYLEPHPGVDSVAYVADCAQHAIQQSTCSRVKVEKQYHQCRPHLPQGIFLGLKWDNDRWKQRWKFDIWVLDRPLIQRYQQQLQQFKQQLTPTRRRLILDMKHRMMTPSGRVTSGASFHIYQAVLCHHWVEPDDIIHYLIDQDLSIPLEPHSPWR